MREPKKGFAAYSASTIAFYYSPLIRAQYAARFHGLTPTVQFNDITFALHALALCVVSTTQYLLPRVWGFTPSLGNRPSRAISGIGIGCVVGVAVVLAKVGTSPARASTEPAVASWVWLDVVYAVSYVKLLVTLVKYTPQVVFNHRNRSTAGWSISMILLDFSGGVLSITQQAIDSYLQADWSGITGNPVKFALGNVSMIYDVVFMTQHYVLYPEAAEKRVAEREALARMDDEERQLS